MADFLVNFLIVGTQKGGTTALGKFLSQHPEICFAPNKEVHFFDSVTYDPTADPSLINQQYQRAFPNWQGQQLIGEATPIYMYFPFIAEHIYDYNPQMKLIFLLRDPVDRAISQYQMERGRGLEWLPLPIALALEPLRLWYDRDNFQEKSSRRCHSYIDRGFYARQILQMQRYFPPQQMLFLKTSDLWQHHQATLRKIYDFLGIADQTIMPPQELVFYQEQPIKANSVIHSLINSCTKYYLQYRFRKANLELEKFLGWDNFHQTKSFHQTKFKK